MILNPPPSRTSLLERDRKGQFTGQLAPVWVKWFGEFFQALKDGDPLLAAETVARIAGDLAEALARAAAILVETNARIAADAAHVALADPHTVYQKESEKNAASGYAGLSAGSKLTGSQQTYGTTANTATQGNDSRFTTIAADINVLFDVVNHIFRGNGSPEGVVVGDFGDMYFDLDGGAGATLWVKESDDGLDTGWAAK